MVQSSIIVKYPHIARPINRDSFVQAPAAQSAVSCQLSDKPRIN